MSETRPWGSPRKNSSKPAAPDRYEPLLVRALAAKAGRIDADATVYAKHLANTRHDDAMLAWLASVSEAR